MAADVPLPAGCSARAARFDDLPAVHRLVSSYEQQVLGEPLMDLEDLEADWQRPRFDAERDSLLVHAGEELVAWGEVFTARRLSACVHPSWWGRGVGSALLDWAAGRSREQGGDLLGQTVPDADAAAAELFRSRGWSPRWTSWVLEMPVGQAIPPRSLPAGYALRALGPGQDERAAFQVVEEAFNEWPGREPSTYEDWAATVLGRPGFEPWQLLLVVRRSGDEEQVVGACHLVMSGETGWVNQVAVAREHRSRGIAQALLAAAFGEARERGAPRAELSTDSRTGALALYERLGMRVTSSFTHWAGEPA